MAKQLMVPATMAIPQAHLREPIYNEAVHDPEDLLYEGSDDEEYNSPSEKRMRYENAGRGYLSGRDLYLLSASLKGPFDHKSGWVNPWQSRGRKHAQFKSKLHQTLSKSSREIAESPMQMKPVPDDCMQCHLPSPESLSQEPVSDSCQYMEEDELARVEQWRGDVSQIELRKDSFWAGAEDNDIKSTRKRRTNGSMWLKRLPTKKMRIQDGFDDTSTPSTQASITRYSDEAPDHTPTRAKRRRVSYKPVVHGRKLVSPGQTGDSEDELSMVNIIVPRAVAQRMAARAKELAAAEASGPSLSYLRVLEVAQSGLSEPHWRGIVGAKNLRMQATIFDTNEQTVDLVSQYPICISEGKDVCEEESATMSSGNDTALSAPKKIASTSETQQDHGFGFEMRQGKGRSPNQSPAPSSIPEDLGPSRTSDSSKDENLGDEPGLARSWSTTPPIAIQHNDDPRLNEPPAQVPLSLVHDMLPQQEHSTAEEGEQGPFVAGIESAEDFKGSEDHNASGDHCSGTAGSGLFDHTTEVGSTDGTTQVDLEQPVISEETKRPTTPEPLADGKRLDSQGTYSLKSVVSRICSQSPWKAVSKLASFSRQSPQTVPQLNGNYSKEEDQQATAGDKTSKSSPVDNCFGTNSRHQTPENGVYQVNEITELSRRPSTSVLSRLSEPQCPKAALPSPESQRLTNTPSLTPSKTPSLRQPKSSACHRRSPQTTFDQPDASSSLPRVVASLPQGQSLRSDLWPRVLEATTTLNETLPLIPSHHIHDRAGDSLLRFSHHMNEDISNMEDSGMQTPGARPTSMEESQDSRVASQLQTPWVKEQMGMATISETTPSGMREESTVLEGKAVVNTSVIIPAEQSPWDSTNENIRSMTRQPLRPITIDLNQQNIPLSPATMIPKAKTRSANADSQASSSTRLLEQRSPFDLLLVSPERPQRKRKRGGPKGNLKVARVNDDTSPSNSSMNRPRVSFAPLPHETDNSDGDSTFTKHGKTANYASMMESLSLRGSPPPEMPLDEVPDDERQHFSKHFEAITKRASDGSSRQRILPAPLQQVLNSPETDAMAKAFITADGMQKEMHWHEKSVYSIASSDVGDEPPDDAEEVLNNLEEYLGAPWDINKALEEEERAFRTSY